MELWVMSGVTVLGFWGVLGGIFGRFAKPQLRWGLVSTGFLLLVAAIILATIFGHALR